ncbi:MAG: sigma-54-dependent Fis family transcriptional regulator [Nitrospinae bacterium]|nr:sigma-54-dependent Fis family transcriptional regulator [Nitrospinota bacterium]
MTEEKRPVVLAVDDEEDNTLLLKGRLYRRGYDVETAASGAEALSRLADLSPDIVLLDVMMPGMDGFETCRRIKEMPRDEFLPVILLTARDDKESKVKGLDIGADDYVTKPFDIDELEARIRAMLRIRELQGRLSQKEQEVKRLNTELKGQYTFENIVGASATMQEIFEKMQGAARITSPVIITGESGTGKELVARGIHYASPRGDKPFIPVNCAALPPDLIESELFGHKKGSFTGAVKESGGLFKAADGGTIFLDEIGEMPKDVQAKLLRVLQEGAVRPVGGSDEIKIDVRVIAATNVDLEDAIEEGAFREDLYYRITVLSIELPPLRNRKPDLPALATHFIKKFNALFGADVKGIDEAAMEALKNYDWPGNIREFQNVIERCYAYADLEWIGEKHLTLHRTRKRAEQAAASAAPAAGGAPAGGDTEENFPTLEEAEKALVERAMSLADANKVKAAKLLGIHRSRLYKKLEHYGIGL